MDKALKGKKAEYAGDVLKGQDRVFGALYYQVPGEPSTAFDAFKAQLAKDGIKLAAEVPYELDLSRTQEISRTSISKLKAAGVTTVLLAADPFSPLSFTTEATAQEWFPEWVIGPNVSVDLSLAARLYDQKQWVHAFGLTPNVVGTTEAARKPYDLYDWYFHREPPINTYRAIDLSVGLLMGGIHMAGPDLTAQTYGDGLFRIPPQKWSAIAPLSVRGRDGLWPGYGKDYVDLYGTDNLALIWYDPTATGEDEVGNTGTGLYQFADRGQRYGQGQLPAAPQALRPGDVGGDSGHHPARARAAQLPIAHRWLVTARSRTDDALPTGDVRPGEGRTRAVVETSHDEHETTNTVLLTSSRCRAARRPIDRRGLRWPHAPGTGPASRRSPQPASGGLPSKPPVNDDIFSGCSPGGRRQWGQRSPMSPQQWTAEICHCS